MEHYPNLYSELYSYENLELAFKKARKRKTLKPYVVEFEKNLEENLLQLQNELIFHTYRPKPLQSFILRDPKTRKISKSAFRDRIVHHAICNVIELVFERNFIHDSYANRKGKGVFKAIKRFGSFSRRVSKNNTQIAFVLKVDIQHYFETVNHELLFSVLKQKITDQRMLWLIRIILSNYKTKEKCMGMPLGNLTSQFFANVFLNELDQYFKHKLKIRYYFRYVDDCIVFHRSKEVLEKYKAEIDRFLKKN